MYNQPRSKLVKRYQMEARLQQMLADYMRVTYPKIIFRSDFAAGIKMTMGQAMKHKRLQHGSAYPDFFVAAANRGYHGLFLELKHLTAHNLPYLKDGSMSKSRHLQDQHHTLQVLSQAGYYARFAIGFDHAKAIVDWYLDDQIQDEPPHTNGLAPADQASIF